MSTVVEDIAVFKMFALCGFLLEIVSFLRGSRAGIVSLIC